MSLEMKVEREVLSVNINHLDELLIQVEEEMTQLQESVAQLKDEIALLTAENNRLRMQQYEQIDQITLLNQPRQSQEERPLLIQEETKPNPSPPVSKTPSGHERLQSFYDEGIHICHHYFGSRRDPQEACIFCQDILDTLGEN